MNGFVIKNIIKPGKIKKSEKTENNFKQSNLKADEGKEKKSTIGNNFVIKRIIRKSEIQKEEKINKSKNIEKIGKLKNIKKICKSKNEEKIIKTKNIKKIGKSKNEEKSINQKKQTFNENISELENHKKIEKANTINNLNGNVFESKNKTKKPKYKENETKNTKLFRNGFFIKNIVTKNKIDEFENDENISKKKKIAKKDFQENLLKKNTKENEKNNENVNKINLEKNFKTKQSEENIEKQNIQKENVEENIRKNEKNYVEIIQENGLNLQDFVKEDSQNSKENIQESQRLSIKNLQDNQQFIFKNNEESHQTRQEKLNDENIYEELLQDFSTVSDLNSEKIVTNSLQNQRKSKRTTFIKNLRKSLLSSKKNSKDNQIMKDSVKHTPNAGIDAKNTYYLNSKTKNQPNNTQDITKNVTKSNLNESKGQTIHSETTVDKRDNKNEKNCNYNTYNNQNAKIDNGIIYKKKSSIFCPKSPFTKLSKDTKLGFTPKKQNLQFKQAIQPPDSIQTLTHKIKQILMPLLQKDNKILFEYKNILENLQITENMLFYENSKQNYETFCKELIEYKNEKLEQIKKWKAIYENVVEKNTQLVIKQIDYHSYEKTLENERQRYKNDLKKVMDEYNNKLVRIEAIKKFMYDEIVELKNKRVRLCHYVVKRCRESKVEPIMLLKAMSKHFKK